MNIQLLALGGYLLVVGAFVVFLMIVTHLLGERHSQRGTGTPYESGVLPTGSTRIRFSADFYLIAMFFVIFDVSAIFIFAWAVAARELGWPGYAAIVVFVLETAAGLAYLWRMGAFRWGARRLAAHKERHGLGNASTR
jgi:NADH-quinone oxidoreductase subunit A